ncbi:hypothetical protein MHY85_13730 [Cellulomonas sp. ACRRI]|uniref:hypothetical protein n=1 Tax=Cellulomonas sp. ACRRI TaxID=2918188 RepID=UPI001EF237C3|nr:hypothetical protein [Cellulomonas sp. ACRRI]MCG7287029.1 hypothetical protein [Cellulomonas sp. ACRRI]
MLTAPQLFWTGLTSLVLGVLGSAGAQALYVDRLWASPATFALLSAAATGLTVLGAALVAGALVLAGVRRAPGVRQAGDPVPPAGAPR